MWSSGDDGGDDNENEADADDASNADEDDDDDEDEDVDDDAADVTYDDEEGAWYSAAYVSATAATTSAQSSRTA